jgi:NAD(P)H-dependent flavin oxidoreductase YrpB (nitropropane dioxygenase family)
METLLTKQLKIQHPIIQGGMQYIGYAEFASCISNSGGLGKKKK